MAGRPPTPFCHSPPPPPATGTGPSGGRGREHPGEERASVIDAVCPLETERGREVEGEMEVERLGS